MSPPSHTEEIHARTESWWKDTHASGLLAWCTAEVHNLAARVAATRSKANVESVEKGSQHLEQTVAEHENREAQAQAQRRSAAAEHGRGRQWPRPRQVRQHGRHEVEATKEQLDERKERKAQEKRRLAILTGIARGFDPTAGIVSPHSPAAQRTPESGGCFVNSGWVPRTRPSHLDERDELGRKTGRRWEDSTMWGIEFGGLGTAGQHGYGSLKKKDKDKKRESGWSQNGSRTSTWSRRLE